MGYERKDAGIIMNKLKKIGCNHKTVKIRSNYIRKGSICDYMYFGNGFDCIEAIEALRAYCVTNALGADMEHWKNVLIDISNNKDIL